MLDPSVYFKISSETDINELLYLNQELVKRINILKRQQVIPKAEIVEKKVEEVVIQLEKDENGK